MAKKVTVTMEFLVNDNPEFELEKLNRLDMASEIVDRAEDELCSTATASKEI
jgi:hypothetical protein